MSESISSNEGRLVNNAMKGKRVMTIEDKTFLLNICQMPRLGLSQRQIGDIERVIDGGQVSSVPAVAIPYAQAAEVLGFHSKSSEKTIMKFIREGRLVKACSGRVTMESVLAFGKAG